jgi:molybdenum cofactor biosynthesis enzyme MoaA
MVNALKFDEAIIVEATNICNYECPLCRIPQSTRPKGYMSFANFKKIFDDLQNHFKQINFTMCGEPTLNVDLPRMIDYCKGKASTLLYTNGSTLKKNAEALVDAGLTEIQISIDGVTAEEYQSYRVGGNFANVILGIDELLAARGNNVSPKIALQFIIMKNNECNVEVFKKNWVDTGVDVLRFKTVNVFFIPYAFNSELQSRMHTYLPTNSMYSRYRQTQVKKFNGHCSFLKKSMVLWNGDVALCCYDVDGENVIGNILGGNKYLDIYNSLAYKVARERIKKRSLHICENCADSTSAEVEVINLKRRKTK